MSKYQRVKNNHKSQSSRSARDKKCRQGSGRGVMVIYSALMVLVVGLGLYYLGILNSRAQISFETAELQKKLEGLKEVNKNLEINVSELQQVDRVEAEAAKLGLVGTAKAEYLSVKNKELATR